MQARIWWVLVGCALFACGPSLSTDDAEPPFTLVSHRLDAVIVSNGRELNGRELNGRELNGRELNGRELNGRELNGRELNGRELNGRELNGRELNGRELNGRELNGRELNGRELNGRELNGRELNGVSLNDASLGGVALRNVHVEGSVLVATLSDASSPLRGAELVGVVLTDGALRLRVDAVVPSPKDSDIFFHQVSFSKYGGAWFSLCGSSADGTEILSIPLAGAFDGRSSVPGGGSKIRDPSLVTFACREYVIAKCIEWGYAPWRLASRCSASGTCWPVDLDVMHEACTRVARADYCGDGRSFTREATLINIYDGVGIEADTEPWEIEAEWNEQGAQCLDHRRITNSSQVPHCERDLSLPTCGDPSHFDTGTLIMTERSPRPPLAKSR